MKTAPVGFTALPFSNRETAVSVPGTDVAGFTSAERAHEEIQHRAYSMWVCAGRPEHHEVADWLAAEIEVMNEV